MWVCLRVQRIDLGRAWGRTALLPAQATEEESTPCATDPPLLEPTLAAPVAVISLGVVRSSIGMQAPPGEARARLKDRHRLLTLLRAGLPAALGPRWPQEQSSMLLPGEEALGARPPAAASLRLALLAPALVDLLAEGGDWVSPSLSGGAVCSCRAAAACRWPGPAPQLVSV